jgi:hypothetical protein
MLYGCQPGQLLDAANDRWGDPTLGTFPSFSEVNLERASVLPLEAWKETGARQKSVLLNLLAACCLFCFDPLIEKFRCRFS